MMAIERDIVDSPATSFAAIAEKLALWHRTEFGDHDECTSDQAIMSSLKGATALAGFMSQEPEDNTARAVRLVAMDRVWTLFDLLRGGKIIASGHSGDGQRIDISPALWQSRRCYVDFETGELFQLSASDAPKLFASGISLEAAMLLQEEMATASDIDGLPKPLEDEPYKRWVDRVCNSIPSFFEKLSPRGEKAKLARQLVQVAKASGKTWKFDSLRDALWHHSFRAGR